jgi:hypothetical protein
MRRGHLVTLLVLFSALLLQGQERERGPAEPSIIEEKPVSPAEKVSKEEGLEALPEWSPEDALLLREGGLIPGEELLSETIGDLVLPPPPVPVPEIIPLETDPEVSENGPELIGEEYIDEYFGQRPVTFLLDPQELLSRQALRDRESFLQYHAGDSEVDLYVYLFDGEQELPEGVTIEQVFEQHYQSSGPTALVFYYLGMPERSQLALSESITEVVSLDEQKRALRNAIQEAFEKSDSAYQLDNFAVELSIRLYWFEKAMAGADPTPPMAAAINQEGTPPVLEDPAVALSLLIQLKPVGIGVGILLGAVGLGFLGRWIAEQRFRYTFPEVESAILLGAPHAAGVGAVVSFGSAQLPAAQQRDQVPDYLQRM